MSDLLRRLPRRHRRDAFRALRGSVLRTELYALDGSARQNKPYTVTESLTGVAQVVRSQAASGDVVLAFAPLTPPPSAPQPDRPIFFAHGLAQRTTQWERGEDPMTQVSFTADYDNYGQARRQLRVALPRGWERTASIQEVDASAAAAEAYATATGQPLLLPALAADALAATGGRLPRKLLGHSAQYYDGGAFEGLGYGQLGRYGALTRAEVLILTDELVQAAYGSTPLLLAENPAWTSEYPQAFRDAFAAAYQQGPAGSRRRAGYRYVQAASSGLGTGGYYQTTERRQYDFQLTGASAPARRYGLVVALLDALGTVAGATAPTPQRVSRVSYDAYALLPVQTTDALGHQTTARYDYRLLQARLVTDPNQNRTAYGFSALGLLQETALLGKFGAGEGDVKTEAATPAQVPAYVPSTWLAYNFHAFDEGNQPAWVKTVQREQHYAVSPASEMLVKVEYSDGFGRLLQTRAQAEDVLFGDATFGDSGLPADATAPNQPAVGVRNTNPGNPNVVVSGWQVYDNKGRVVEKYEPFFSRDFAFVASEAAGRGHRVRMMYDPRGQLVRTRNPDGTEQRVLYGMPNLAGELAALAEFRPTPWETYSYDANDLAHETHRGLPAATAVAAHWYTPQSATVDALGRVVQTTDRLEPASTSGPLVKVVMRYAYDLQGNRTRVTDAYGRVSFEHVYDLKPKAGEDEPGANVLWTRHLDGGTRRAMFDGAGQPLQGQDAKGALTLHAYDALGRPTDAWARDQAGEDVTRRQHLEYGANDGPSQALNAVGQLTTHYDEAGRMRLVRYDFKGNLLEKERQVVADDVFTGQWAAQAEANWQSVPAGFNRHWEEPNDTGRLSPMVYQTSTRYDALNRATRLTLPQEAGANPARPVLTPSYNRAGALAQVSLTTGSAPAQVLVERVAYNARGQRLLLARGNGLMTRYTYDTVSFRLRRLRTEASATSGDTLTPLSGTVRQDTAYSYDLAGNITATQERAPHSGVGGTDELERLFQYDALYRLLSATGRENRPTAPTPWQDSLRSEGVPSTTAYTQHYTYDLLGNIEQLRHTAASSPSSFTRQFNYGTRTTNYLQSVQIGAASYGYVYDANGNVVREEQSRHLSWDAANQLGQFATWTGAGTAPTLLAYYVYSGGQRVKKLTQTSATTWQVTVYVDGGLFEHHYEVSNSTQTGEQTTLHVLDGQSRLYQRRSGDALGDLRPAELYTLEDHLGSAAATVDGTGADVSREEYYPFGETSFGSHAKQRYRFCGKERDQESGLYYYGMRYYTPWLCRFMSVDPLADSYAFYTPYQYAGNRPIAFIDLDGAEPIAPPIMRSPMPFPMRPNVNTRNLAEPMVNPGGQQQRAPIGAVTGPGYAFDSYGNKVPAPSYYVYRVQVNTLQPPVTEEEYKNTNIIYQTDNAPGIYSYEDYKNEYSKIAAYGNALFNKNDKEPMFLYRGGGNTLVNFTPALKDTRMTEDDPKKIPKPGLSTFTNPLAATQGQGGKVQVLSVALLKLMGFVLDFKGDHVGIRPPEPLNTNTLLVQWAETKEGLKAGTQPPHLFSILVKQARVGDETLPTNKKKR
jgi:RHS repeat-associated protein